MMISPLAVAFALTLCAQGDEESAPILSLSGGPHRHASVYFDVDPAGAVLARGRGYKASVDAGGFTFIPFLGSDAPQNYPLHLRLGSARRGPEPIAIPAEATVQRTGNRATIDRGEISVRYDLTPDGVEQSFALGAAPGTGDLVLTLELETELSPAPQGRGFSFSNGRGGVQYGAAAVFDSQGRRADVDASLRHGEIHLTVPGAFLDEALWPILIDPLLTPFTIGTSTADLAHPDTAFSPLIDRYCVTYEERFSAADVDVFASYVSQDGTITAGAYVDQSAVSWTSPRVTAATGTSAIFFVVAEVESLAVPGGTDIVAKARFQTEPFSAPIPIDSATAAYTCAAPDVGIDGHTPAGSTFLVAFNRVYPSGRKEIYSTIASGFGAFDLRPVATRLTHSTSAPAVSSSSGTCCISNTYVVGWSETELATGASSVRTKIIRFDGLPASATFTVAGPSVGSIYFDVDVSATSVRSVGGVIPPLPYLVTYDDRLSSMGDAYVAVCVDGPVRNTYELQVSEHADLVPNQNDLVVATGLGEYMLGYEENGALLVTIVEPVAGELAVRERRRVALGADLVPGSLATAAAIYSAPANWQSLFVWSQGGSGSHGIMGSFASTPSAPAVGIQYCYGSPNSTGERGFILVTGSGEATLTHTLGVEGLPPGAFGFFLASLTTGHVPGAGGSQGTLCVGGDVGRFGIYQADGGGFASQTFQPSQIPQPQGPVAAMSGERWHFQSWHRDAPQGVATSNFTNGATLQFR